MPSEAIRYALASIYVSLAETASLATGKPVGELSGFLMRRMAEEGPPGSADLCLFLADCVAPPRHQEPELSLIEPAPK